MQSKAEAKATSQKLLDNLEASVKSGACSIGFALARAMLGGIEFQQVWTANDWAEICGHRPCPICVNDCDHPDCLIEGTGKLKDALFKTHDCIFPRCERHKGLTPNG